MRRRRKSRLRVMTVCRILAVQTLNYPEHQAILRQEISRSQGNALQAAGGGGGLMFIFCVSGVIFCSGTWGFGLS